MMNSPLAQVSVQENATVLPERPEPRKPDRRGWWSLAVSAVVLFLGVTNYLSLTNDTFRGEAVRMLPFGLVRPASPSELLTASRLQEAALREARLEQEQVALRQQLAAMARDALVLRHANIDLVARERSLGAKLKIAEERRLLGVDAARRLGASMKARIGRGVARNLATLPGKVLPAIGAAVVVGSTALDLQDLCDSMRDMASLNAAVGLPGEDDRAVCGIRIGSVRAVVSDAMQNVGAAKASAMRALGMAQLSAGEHAGHVQTTSPAAAPKQN